MDKFTTVIVLFLCSGGSVVQSINFRREYHTDITFPCASRESTDAEHSARVLTNRAWSLPGGQTWVKGTSDTLNDIHNVHLSNETFELSIQRISDVNFGVYLCVLVWNDSSIRVVRHGLNVGGPVYDSLIEKSKRNALVGGISAAVVLTLVLLVYAVWYFYCSEKRRRERRLAVDLAKGVDRYDTRAYDNVGMEMYTKRPSS